MAEPKATPTPGVTTTPDPTVGQQTGTESNLSNWAGSYVTDMLGKGQALSNQAYQGYGGPLTAGSSNLQNQAFQGLAGLTIPTDQMQAFTPQQFSSSDAQRLMNPYLQSALDPQIAEARRQSEIQNLQNNTAATRAGAFGGGRQALMESENQRNLLQNLSGITGTGYKQAYDQALGQFNTEQNLARGATADAQNYGMGALQRQAEMGNAQRGIEQEGISADRAQFEEERDYPYKQVQYQQSLLQGLPLQAQSYTYSQPSALSEFMSGSGGISQLYDMLFGGGEKAAASTGTTGTGSAGVTTSTPAQNLADGTIPV
tara:strand:+ start:301 stop:1245 length:945 start_codon:yes stop_codon:yes gene_type:complete